MPLNDLILALNKSNLDFDPSIIPQLWKATHRIPEQVMDALLAALEISPVEHPEILNLLLAECGPEYTVDVQKSVHDVESLNK